MKAVNWYQAICKKYQQQRIDDLVQIKFNIITTS